MEKDVRDRKRPIKIYVTPLERELLQNQANKCRVRSVGDYLRQVGQGYEPRSRFDQDFIREMMRIKADQGRLGGLLKLWLSEKPGEGTSVRNVRSVLNQIEATQQQLARLILKECTKL